MTRREISAVIPLRSHEEEAAACRRIGGRTTLEIAIEKLVAPSTGVSRVFVAGRDLGRVLRTVLDRRVSILEADIPALAALEEDDPMEGLRSLALSIAGPVHEVQDGDCHVMVLDPLRPLISASEIRTALQGFLVLGREEYSRIGVVAVSRVRNHHHPKKVLCLSGDGALAHFDREGSGIYQRQQLAGDDYYVIDPALAVIGRCGEETDWDPAGWVAVPIGDNGVRVADPETLALAKELHSVTHLTEQGRH